MIRRLVHPGPRAEHRIESSTCTLLPVEGTLSAGGILMDEVAALYARHGCRGGVLRLDGATCDPFRYVLPALATDDRHAAYYSATHAPEGVMRIDACTASVGWRDGTMFLHGHGRWSGAPGTAMGHVLPLETRLAADAAVSGLGSPDAWFEAVPDAETNFTLFSPAGGGGNDGAFVRIRPGEDVCEAVGAVCDAHAIPRAHIHGLGSICDPVFADGRALACVATEVRIDAGHVEDRKTVLDVSLVDVDGMVHRGRLAPGANRVGVTFEILIERRT